MHPYGLGAQQTSQSAVSHPALFIACCGVWRWQLQVGQRASQSERDSVGGTHGCEQKTCSEDKQPRDSSYKLNEIYIYSTD